MFEIRRESPRDRAAEAFCNPALQIDMDPDAADLAIAWVQRWARHIGVFCGSVALTLLILGALL